MQYLVQLGLFGHVGRFRAPHRELLPRDARVVCRTARGLEVGTVLKSVEMRPPIASSESAQDPSDAAKYDGEVLRRVTVEDHLLLARLERNRERAFQECCDLLTERGLNATLVDVEHLFDGQSIFFYFLGEVTSAITALTRELAEAYESKVQFRDFTDAVERGCGPDCGTEAAAGCGTDGGCAACAIATACKPDQPAK